ncbi:glycosyltransferase family 4 protein [Apibacter raozihei]|uniref:glycosyltransferase family 4 protein n=1 Tax=Apibacter raozihei TaxID=2500547 RepID=UPI000FE373CF|nr:glycosyltransferase family 4 protein [Apibacter raozihei]
MKIHYACFDAFPTSKGASTHIYHTIKALEPLTDRLNLYCLRGGDDAGKDFGNATYIYDFHYPDKGDNYPKKAGLFTEKIFDCMEVAREEGIAQFRDIWGGLGMINRPNLKTIFEVNALTSLELPVRYPLLTESFIKNIEQLENTCLQSCNHIITPSAVTKKYIESRFQISESKITVIPNGAEIDISTRVVDSLPADYLVYFGALQPWQGVDILIKSFKYLEDYPQLKLIICSSVKEKFNKNYDKLIQNLGFKDKIIFYNELDKESLHYIIKNSKASVAPLKFGDRNMVQGCCPIKILETMASKTPLIASDLPVVRELIGENYAFLFEPEDETDLSRCIRFILDNPTPAKDKAFQGYEFFKAHFTWQHHTKKLQDVYFKLYKS